MSKKEDYQTPMTVIVTMPDEPLLALSAKVGKHVYDEGLDTADGWADVDYYDYN